MNAKLREALAELDEGRAGALIGIAMRARGSDERCSCVVPVLEGWDLMCRECLLENEEQRFRKKAAQLAPHAYIQHERVRMRMCAFCKAWQDDPRHVATVDDEAVADVANREMASETYLRRKREGAW